MIKANSPKLRLLFSFLFPFLSFAQDCDLNYTGYKYKYTSYKKYFFHLLKNYLN